MCCLKWELTGNIWYKFPIQESGCGLEAAGQSVSTSKALLNWGEDSLLKILYLKTSYFNDHLSGKKTRLLLFWNNRPTIGSEGLFQDNGL